MSALNSFLAKGRRRKKKGGAKPKPAAAPAPAAAPRAPDFSAPAPVAAPVPAPAPVSAPAPASSSGWVEVKSQKKILRDKRVADMSELVLSDEDFSEDEAELADKHHARNALFKTMRRARRRAEKAAAKKDAGKAETVKEKPKETAAPQKYVSWRVRQARQLEKKGTGKPPKMDDPNDFPSLGGAAPAPVAAAAPAVGAWGASVANLPDDLDDESSDDEGPPPLEPVGAHLRRAAEKAKREAEGAEVEEDGEATTEIEAKEMSESAFKEKVEYMVSDFQDTHQHTDVTEPLAAIDDIVAMSRRSLVPKQVIIMGLFGTDRDRDAINQLLPKLLEASVLDRPTLRAGVEEVFAELDELCLDEPQTPKYLAQMVKKINFRSVVPDSALPKPVADALAGKWTLPAPVPSGPRVVAAPAPAPAPAAAPAPPAPAAAAAPAPAAAAAPNPPPAAAATAEAGGSGEAAAPAAAGSGAEAPDPNADLFKTVKKKKKKKKKAFVPSDA